MSAALVEVLIERCGSQLQAAEMIGVTPRHVQKWCVGKSSPSQLSLKKISMFLEGDNPAARERRIAQYVLRAEEGQDLFR